MERKKLKYLTDTKDDLQGQIEAKLNEFESVLHDRVNTLIDDLRLQFFEIASSDFGLEEIDKSISKKLVLQKHLHLVKSIIGL